MKSTGFINGFVSWISGIVIVKNCHMSKHRINKVSSEEEEEETFDELLIKVNQDWSLKLLESHTSPLQYYYTHDF